MDSKTRHFLDAFASEVGEQIGRLYTISIIQTSILLDLATAVKNEKSLSPDTQDNANKALQNIDRLILKLDEAMIGIDKNAFDVKTFLGDADE